MARARQKPSGMWEIGVRHPSLPGGRKYFTFESEDLANGFGEQWKTMKMAGLQPPAALLQPSGANHSLGLVLREWSNSGLAAPSQYVTLGSLIAEVGAVKLVDADYAWLAAYVQRLKVENNLAPNSIRHRVQALGRAIDEFARHNPKLVIQNPVRLLPKGYSTYTDVDQKLVAQAGGQAKADVARDRRLHRDEEPRIIAALSGKQRDDRERGLLLPGGNALLTMFILIVYSGLRLREAYMLRRQQIDFDSKVIRVQSSKQWRGKVVFREVPMRQEVHAALTHYLSTRAMLPATMLFPFTEEEPGMTLTKVSQRLSARFKSAFEYAGCVNLREHDLRHEATCRWLEMRDSSGNWMFRLEEVNRIMGWSANSTMAQRYASFRGSDLADRMWSSAGPASATPAESGGAA